jgi:predicted kinase
VHIYLPSDSLVVLIGAAGCGKSKWAAARFLPTQIVSSDECRALVSDDPNNPRASADAFALMHTIIGMRLKRGRLTVADATSVHRDKREALLEIARSWRRPAIAVVFDLPAAVCQERNQARAERVVPPAAIAGQIKLLRESLPGLAAEGFSEVHVLESAEAMDAAQVLVEQV